MIPNTDRRQWPRLKFLRWIARRKGRLMISIDDTIPPVSWREVEAIFYQLATTEPKKRMVRHLTEGARKQAPFMTAGGVMTELIYIAAAMLDASFRPSEKDLDVSEASLSSSASPPLRPGS
jgi:hypothetical protein